MSLKPRPRPIDRGTLKLFGVGALALLASCSPTARKIAETLTPSPIPSPFPTETPVPPTPTESAPALVLDKPIPTDFDISLSYEDLYSLNVMPTITEDNVSSGAWAGAIDALWRTRPDLGVYDANGNVILPPGVQPVRPEQWKLITADGILVKNLVYITWEDAPFPYSTYTGQNSPVQPSNERAKIKDANGNIDRFVLTNRLYYYDQQGILHVQPVISRFDISKIRFDDQPPSNLLRHAREIFASTRVSTKAGDYIPKFMVGFNEGGNIEEDVVLTQFVDLQQFFSEPMQAKRDQMMQDIKNGVFNPADLGKVWVQAAGFQSTP